jgi:WD40 repeat protein
MPSTSRPFTLVVKGMPSGAWDDCLSRIDIQKGPATALCHGNRYFAIGSSTGQIWLYDSDTIQNRSTMAHGERISFLLFSPDDRYLMSRGPKNLTFWSLISLESVYSFPIQGRPLRFAFMSNTELLGSLQPYQVVKWSVPSANKGYCSMAF